MHGPGRLPVQLSTFIGREAETGELAELIGQARLVSVTGLGGAGKSRLAVAVAQRVASGFPDGVWWVPLAAVADAAGVARAVAAAVRAPDGQPPTAALLERLRTKRALLICDTCEHLSDAVAELVEELLAGCAGVRVLATSQRRLGIAGEITWTVPPLSADESVRLFVDRARNALPQFDLTEDNRLAVAEVCRRLEGVPLAVELAAARVKVLSVQQIAARLADALSLLVGDARTAVPRHRSLRATLDWSFGLLGGPERGLLAELSVIEGGFDLDDVEAMYQAPGGPALDVLTELVDRSFVTATPAGHRVRYRLPEPVRQYALAQRGGPVRDQRPMLNGHGPRSSSDVWWFCYLRGYYREGRAWLLDALSEATGAPEPLRAKGRAAAEALARLESDYEANAEASLVADRFADPEVQIWSMIGLGATALVRGEYPTAAALLTESLALSRARGYGEGVGWSLFQLGMLALHQGEPAGADRLLRESLAEHRALGERWRLPSLMEALAGTAMATADAVAAARMLGAADGLRTAAGIAVPGAERSDHRRTVAAARIALAPERFAELWAAGQAAAQSGVDAVARTPIAAVQPRAIRPIEAVGLPDELRIQALGTACVHRGATLIESSVWTYAKPREMLYYLLSNANSTKEQIGAALWPSTPPAKLRNSFHTTLHHLRRALGDPAWITYRQGRYAFNRTWPFHYDVEVLEAGLTRIHSTEAAALPYLVAAVEAYQGDFLTDLPGERWIDGRRVELRTAFERVLLALGRRYAQAGQYAQAVQTYLRAIKHDNLLEVAHRELIHCYARMGERARALHHYNNLVTLLRDQLGIQPSTETRDLYAALRSGHAPALSSPSKSPSS